MNHHVVTLIKYLKSSAAGSVAMMLERGHTLAHYYARKGAKMILAFPTNINGIMVISTLGNNTTTYSL